MAALLATLSSLVWGCSDFAGGWTTRRAPLFVVVFWSQGIGLAVALLGAPWFGGTLDAASIGWGALGGIGGAMGLMALYHGLANSRAAIVAPAAAVFGAGIPVAVGVAQGDRPGVAAWAGIAIALPALWLVSQGLSSESDDAPNHRERSKGLLVGVLAGIGFGAFFVFLDYTPDDAGLWPLVPSRIASIALLMVILLTRRQAFKPATWTKAVVLGTVGAGAGDMVANMLFLAASQRGLLSVVAVLSSLYPAVTVTLARVYGERVAAAQWIGVTMSLLAVGLIVS